MSSKLIERGDRESLFPDALRAGRRLGFTNGCFDVLHLGHVKYLEAAKRECEVLLVGLNSDPSVRRLKGDDRPLNPVEARAGVLAALESVDHILIFEEDTPEELINIVRPDVLLKGGDWAVQDIVGADIVRSYGGEVKVIPFEEGYSTTALIEKVLERYNG